MDLVLGWPVSWNQMHGMAVRKVADGKHTVDVFLTEAADKWKAENAAVVRATMGDAGWWPTDGPWFPAGVWVTVDRLRITEPDMRARDIDNLLKLLWDTLTEAGVWADDSQIRLYNQVGFGVPCKGQGRLEIRLVPGTRCPLG